MAAIDQVSAPLVLRDPQGNERIVVACFHHPQGLVCLATFWHLSTPDKAAQLIRGELKGEGPWRIGDYRLRVLGCQQTDPHLADAFAEWDEYLANHGEHYPPRAQIIEIARRLGCLVD